MCTSACNSLLLWKHAHFLHEVVFVHMFMCTSVYVYVHVCVRVCVCVCMCARVCVNLPERTTKQICVNLHGFSQEHNKALSIRIILPHAHFWDFLFLFLPCACMYDVNIGYNFVYGYVHIMSMYCGYLYTKLLGQGLGWIDPTTVVWMWQPPFPCPHH